MTKRRCFWLALAFCAAVLARPVHAGNRAAPKLFGPVKPVVGMAVNALLSSGKAASLAAAPAWSALKFSDESSRERLSPTIEPLLELHEFRPLFDALNQIEAAVPADSQKAAVEKLIEGLDPVTSAAFSRALADSWRSADAHIARALGKRMDALWARPRSSAALRDWAALRRDLEDLKEFYGDAIDPLIKTAADGHLRAKHAFGSAISQAFALPAADGPAKLPVQAELPGRTGPVLLKERPEEPHPTPTRAIDFMPIQQGQYEVSAPQGRLEEVLLAMARTTYEMYRLPHQKPARLVDFQPYILRKDGAVDGLDYAHPGRSNHTLFVKRRNDGRMIFFSTMFESDPAAAEEMLEAVLDSLKTFHVGARRWVYDPSGGIDLDSPIHSSPVGSAISRPQVRIASNQQEWDRLWMEHAAGRRGPAPKVDFAQDFIVGIFGGAKAEGRVIEIEGIEKTKPHLLSITGRFGARGGRGGTSFPYYIAALPRTYDPGRGGSVEFNLGPWRKAALFLAALLAAPTLTVATALTFPGAWFIAALAAAAGTAIGLTIYRQTIGSRGARVPGRDGRSIRR